VSCYTRQLGDLLPDAPTPADKRELDRAVRRYLEMEDDHCPEVWAVVKERREQPAFANGVRAAMRENG
jgi:hypothetical protein